MQALKDIFSPEFWKIALPALAPVVAWFFNERSKLAWEQYKCKEENYRKLLRCLKGFYKATQDRELKNQFLHQLNLLWLYAPDHVIRTAYSFLEKVKTGVRVSEQEGELACGALVEEVRKDLLARWVLNKSNLNARDFRHFIST